MDESHQEYLIRLHKLLVEYFDQGELRTLCFYLGVDYDVLDGEGKTNKARELIKFLERHSRIADLEAEITKQRPRVLGQVASPPSKQLTSQQVNDNTDSTTVQNIYGNNNAIAGPGGSATVHIQSHSKQQRKKKP